MNEYNMGSIKAYSILGVCRTYGSRLDFCPFSLLLRCQNTHAAQLRLSFCRLASGKNHQKSPRSLKVRQTPSRAPFLPACRQTGRLASGKIIEEWGWGVRVPDFCVVRMVYGVFSMKHLIKRENCTRLIILILSYMMCVDNGRFL